MAEVWRLKKFDELSLIGTYAEKFSLDPDHVFCNTSFNTVMNFLWKWKESDEYQERYQFIYSELTRDDSTRSDTASQQ